MQRVRQLIEHAAPTDATVLVRRPSGTANELVARALQSFHWPGNVRELADVLECAQILAEDDVITTDDLPETARLHPWRETALPLSDDPFYLTALEHKTVLGSLRNAQGNKVRAAQWLGVSRRSLVR
jgi:two-component system response regulator AtoC